jgi:CRISPR system Cascade subunit CasE
MYLSKLTLNPRPNTRAVQRDLADPYQLHRTILRAFPHAADGGPGRVLFRLEASRDDNPPVLLVQSDKPPDWSVLAAIPGYLLRPPESKELVLRVRTGQRLCFRLRANPTVRRSADGKRHGLLRDQDQRQWLLRKAAESGFQPVDFVVRAARRTEGGADKRKQTHLAVDFEGILEVTDPEEFAAAVTAGIGPAKAFGFGLLSVARL